MAQGKSVSAFIKSHFMEMDEHEGNHVASGKAALRYEISSKVNHENHKKKSNQTSAYLVNYPAKPQKTVVSFVCINAAM